MREETLESLFDNLSEQQKVIDFYQRFASNPYMVGLAGGFATALMLHLPGNGYLVIGGACLVGFLSYICYALAVRAEPEINGRTRTIARIYRSHGIDIKRASIVQIQQSYYLWILTAEGTFLLEIGKAFVKAVRQGLKALACLKIPCSGYATDGIIEVESSVPKRLHRKELEFTAMAHFLQDTEYEQIVERFHTSFEEIGMAFSRAIGREIEKTLDQTPPEQLQQAPSRLVGQVVEMPELFARSTISKANWK